MIRPSAVVGLASFTLAVGSVLVLHILSDLDPVERRLSEYAVGSGGGTMIAAFVLIGVGLTILGVLVVFDEPDTVVRLSGLALIVAGGGIAVAGVFPTDPGSSGVAEAIHSRSSALATVLVVAASLAWSLRSVRTTTTARTLAVSGLVLVIVSVPLHDTSVSGVSQRVLWVVLVAWAVLATRVVGRASHEASI